MPLNAKQERFVQEFLVDLNASKAGIRAGYSENSAYSQAHDLLKKPEIQEAIAKAKAKRSQKIEITAERVLQEIARLALSDPRDLLDANGQVKPPSEWDDRIAATISSVKVIEKDGVKTYEVKQWDKNSSLEKLSKHLGVFVEKHEITGRDGGPIEVEDVSDRELARQIAFALAAGKKASDD